MLTAMSAATDMLSKYLVAEASILEGKEARIGDRTFRFEDLDKIIAGRREWEGKVAAERRVASGAQTIGGLGFAIARMDR
jgi:hypothetical protein